MKAGFLQFAPYFADPGRNLEIVKSYLMDTSADLVVLPELALSGYYFKSRSRLMEAAVYIRDNCLPGLAELCTLKDIAVVMGFPEADGDRIYNSSVLVYPGRGMEIYRKMHLFNTEKNVFDTAESGFKVCEYNGVKLGLLVCYDHFFPEAARAVVRAGAQVICHPSNLVLEGKGQLTTRVRAIENRVFWILANRTGTETNDGGSVTFTGGSQIISPDGEILINAGREEQGLGIIEIEPSLADDKKVTPLNHLYADMRPEFY